MLEMTPGDWLWHCRYVITCVYITGLSLKIDIKPHLGWLLKTKIYICLVLPIDNQCLVGCYLYLISQPLKSFEFCCIDIVFYATAITVRTTKGALWRVSCIALFRNSQTHSLNDSIIDLDYFWEFSSKIALLECCQHSIMILLGK